MGLPPALTMLKFAWVKIADPEGVLRVPRQSFQANFWPKARHAARCWSVSVVHHDAPMVFMMALTAATSVVISWT
jgi:hypothetical protein